MANLKPVLTAALKLTQDQRLRLIEQLVDSLDEAGRSFVKHQPERNLSKSQYTVAEAARLCGVSSSTIRKWFDTGQLRGFGVSGPPVARVYGESVDSYLAAHHSKHHSKGPQPKNSLHSNKVFSPSQAAKILEISPRSVVRKVRRGELKGYFIPGDRIRRIPSANLQSFAKEKGITLHSQHTENVAL